MEIALIMEGSYPYTTGGLSSWTQQLIRELKDRKFKIISIMPSRAELPEQKYEFPPNVTAFRTLFLNDYLRFSPLASRREPRLSRAEATEIAKFLAFDPDVDWTATMSTLGDPKKIGNPIQFLKSKAAWDTLLNFYNTNFPEEDFNRFFWSMISMYVPLISMVQQEGLEADIYHSLSTGYAGLMGLVYRLKYNKPLLLTEHGIYAREREEEILNAKWVEEVYKKFWIRFFYFISTGVYRHAEAVVALFSQNSLLQQRYGAHPERALVIPNGVNVEAFVSQKPNVKGVHVGAIARVVPIKDINTLLRAFHLVLRRIPHAKLSIIGTTEEDRDYYLECLETAKLLGIVERVAFTGQVNVKDYLPYLDVLVLTSLSEGQPLVMLEGMAASIPFVATDVGSCRELIEGVEGDTFGPTGLIVPPVSPQDTADAIVKLLNDVELREQMGRSARRRIETYYRQEMFIDNYRRLYDSVYIPVGANTAEGRRADGGHRVYAQEIVQPRHFHRSR